MFDVHSAKCSVPNSYNSTFWRHFGSNSNYLLERNTETVKPGREDLNSCVQARQVYGELQPGRRHWRKSSPIERRAGAAAELCRVAVALPSFPEWKLFDAQLSTNEVRQSWKKNGLIETRCLKLIVGLWKAESYAFFLPLSEWREVDGGAVVRNNLFIQIFAESENGWTTVNATDNLQTVTPFLRLKSTIFMRSTQWREIHVVEKTEIRDWPRSGVVARCRQLRADLANARWILRRE